MKNIYSINDATLILKYNDEDVPQVSVDNVAVQPTKNTENFLIFENLQFSTYFIKTEQKTTTIKLNN